MAAVLFWILVIGLAKLFRHKRQPKPKPLCAECMFAHIQYAVSGRRAISCTFGGSIRPIRIDVLYCTDYCNRNVPRRIPKMGFAPEPSPVAELEVARG